MAGWRWQGVLDGVHGIQAVLRAGGGAGAWGAGVSRRFLCQQGPQHALGGSSGPISWSAAPAESDAGAATAGVGDSR